MSEIITAIQVAGYRRGRGIIPAGIRWWTHSLYSHVAAVVEMPGQYEVWEANPDGFTCTRSAVLADALREHHDSGQLVDLKAWAPALGPEQLARGYDYLRSIEGHSYDFGGIAAFLTGRSIRQSPSAEFCSEAVMELSRRMGRPLQNMMSCRAYPDHCMISLALRDERTVKL